MTVIYTSQRQEIWAWYWRTWRQRLWKLHLFLFVMATLATSMMLFPQSALSPMSLARAAIAGVLLLGLLALYPMLRFKPQVRTLTLRDTGVFTEIGKRSGVIEWSKIESVIEEGDDVVIQGRSGNAFVVPSRAFDSSEARRAFVRFAGDALRTAR